MIEEALKYMFPSIDFMRDVILQNDGEGTYITHWGLDVPQPTQAELEAAYSEWRAKMDALEAAYSEWRAKMDAKEAALKALSVTDRMQNLVFDGFAFMSELSEGQTNEVYQFNLSLLMSAPALTQMYSSLPIIRDALAQIAVQCPDLAQEIFTTEQLAMLQEHASI